MKKIKEINDNEIKVDGKTYRLVESKYPIFKIGDAVMVTRDGKNASEFKGKGIAYNGVYSDKNWHSNVYKIASELKPTNFYFKEEGQGAYLLKDYNGNEVGYVYNDALMLVEEPKPVFKIGDWVTGSIAPWSSPVRIEKVLEKNEYIVTNAFDDIKDYNESIRTYEAKYLRHATKDEIESHLIKICSERYPIGTKYKNAAHVLYDECEVEGNFKCYFHYDGPHITDGCGGAVYSSGKFAEIIPDKKKLPKTREEFVDMFFNWLDDDKDAFVYSDDTRDEWKRNIRIFLNQYE